MAASARRVGAETSKTRDTLLDHVEKMMLDEGYASVTYRALASAAGVTPSLVQYYFPTLDDIFSRRSAAIPNAAGGSSTKCSNRAPMIHSAHCGSSAVPRHRAR